MTESLLDRVANALFGARKADERADDRELIDELIELVVDAVEPKIRYQPRYKRRLEGPIRAAVAHLRTLARENLEPVTLTREAWSSDHRVNAFFATAEDVGRCLGNSGELREFFEHASNATGDHAFALLGMNKEERQVFAPQMSGDRVVKDVSKVAVCFSDHRVVAPTTTYEATRLDVGKRIIRRLAQIALSGINASGEAATELRARKVNLEARLRQLELARDGTDGVVGDAARVAADIAAAKRDLAEVAGDYAQSQAGVGSMDAAIAHVNDVFSHAERHVAVTHTPLRLDRSGFKVEGKGEGPINELVLTEIAIADGLRGAIVIVRVPRGELPAKADFFATARRYL